MKHVAIRLAVGLLCLVLAGCTTMNSVDLNPQSRFDYPNSNVYPLGKVVGKASTSSIFMPPFLSSEVEEAAIKNALAQKPGADLLINYTGIAKVTMVPFLSVYTLTYEVEGTAAKMNIGTQKLN